MTRRLPLIPTIIVALAVAAMIALGVWQLQRRTEKHAYLARIAANPSLPEMRFPDRPDETMLLRRAHADCGEVTRIDAIGAGGDGYRLVAQCRPPAGAADLLVQLGTTRDPNARVAWRGGTVKGHVAAAPDGRSLIGKLFDHTPQRQMLVLSQPLSGLGPNRRPDLSSIPDNHFAYAVQWFLFAGIAALIYLLALRRRGQAATPDRPS